MAPSSGICDAGARGVPAPGPVPDWTSRFRENGPVVRDSWCREGRLDGEAASREVTRTVGLRAGGCSQAPFVALIHAVGRSAALCVWVASWSRDVPRRRAWMVPGMVVRHNMVVRGGSWELWRTVRAGNTGNRGFHGDRGGTPLHNRLSGTCRGAEPDGTRDAGCGVWDTGRGDGDLAPHAPATSTLETTGPTTEPTSPTATNGIGSRRDHPPALHAPSRQREKDTRDGPAHATSRQREEKVPIAL